MSRDLTASDLARQAMAAADLMRAIASDDDQLCHDMIEGETSLFDAVDAALREIDECDIRAAGSKAREKELADRRRNAERRAETIRAHIQQALVVADLKTAKLATATLTVRDVPPAPMIADESIIPAEYWKQPDPVLDKAKINAAVKDGAAIPGVTMTNGGISLTIRRT